MVESQEKYFSIMWLQYLGEELVRNKYKTWIAMYYFISFTMV